MSAFFWLLVLVGRESSRRASGLVEFVRGWGGGYLPVKSWQYICQEPAGVLLHQVNLHGCKLSTENLLTCSFDHAAHFSEEDEKEEEAASSSPTNAAKDHNINADEEAVKESSETESAGQSHLWIGLVSVTSCESCLYYSSVLFSSSRFWRRRDTGERRGRGAKRGAGSEESFLACWQIFQFPHFFWKIHHLVVILMFKLGFSLCLCLRRPPDRFSGG